MGIRALATCQLLISQTKEQCKAKQSSTSMAVSDWVGNDTNCDHIAASKREYWGRGGGGGGIENQERVGWNFWVYARVWVFRRRWSTVGKRNFGG